MVSNNELRKETKGKMLAWISEEPGQTIEKIAGKACNYNSWTFTKNVQLINELRLGELIAVKEGGLYAKR